MQIEEKPLMVSVRCATYNHVNFVRQCLDGFVMQKTNFCFEVIVHDDASTDGTTNIVREYAEKYPEIIKPMYESENQYSVDEKSMNRRIDERLVGKYIAICEGDDYWMDENKLQLQVDYMEKHPDCTMTCCRTKIYSEKDNRFYGEQYCLRKDGILNPADVVNRTGLYIPTCSIVYRKNAIENYPDYCRNCLVGDYPLQIYCAMKGHIFYFDRVMSVYRRFNSSSWMGQQDWNHFSLVRVKVISSQLEMFKGFAEDYPQYRTLFYDKLAEHINRNIPNRHVSKTEIDKYLVCFAEYMKNYSMRWKMDLIMRKCRIPQIRNLYTLLFMSNYMYFVKKGSDA